MNFLKIEARRDSYGAQDLKNQTVTVGELIAILENYDSDLKVILSHDRGYTFGAVTESNIDEDECLNEE